MIADRTERGARVVSDATVGLMRLTDERRYTATPDQLKYDSMLRQRDYWEQRALVAESALAVAQQTKENT
jgi:hypothetical protein